MNEDISRNMFDVYDKSVYERYTRYSINAETLLIQKRRYNYFRGEKILDIAFGSGAFMLSCPQGKKVYGIDINEYAVKKLSDVGYKVVCGSILQLPFKDNTFDGVNCSDVIEHFFPYQLNELFRELYRVTTENAELLIVTNTPQTVWSGIYHIRPYPFSAIAMLLEDTGFQIVHSWKMGMVRGLGVIRCISFDLYLRCQRFLGTHNVNPLYVHVLAQRKDIPTMLHHEIYKGNGYHAKAKIQHHNASI